MKVIRTLNGNSGCNILLCKNDHSYFVRKLCMDSTYESRFFKQIHKLINFSDFLKKENHKSRICVPEILDVGRDIEGYIYYDMQYVNGLLFNKYINRMPVGDVVATFSIILDFVSLEMKNEIMFDIIDLDKIVKNKLSQLNQNIDINTEHCTDVLLTKTISHGDLTFENILIENETNKIFLIDPMDCYLDNALDDVSKLCTEIFAFWSNRNSGTKINPGIYLALRNAMMNNSEFQKYNNLLKCLVLIDLLRTVPYLHKKGSIELANTIHKIVEMDNLWLN